MMATPYAKPFTDAMCSIVLWPQEVAWRRERQQLSVGLMSGRVMASCRAWAQAWMSPARMTTMASQSRSNHLLMHCKQLQAGLTLSLLPWL